jgi:hypothetical protein
MPTATETIQPFIDADAIRAYARTRYVDPARQAGQRRVVIPVRPIAEALGKLGGINHVCAALSSKRRFQEPNGLLLVDTQGPKSGVSTTVVYTFEFTDSSHLATRPGGLQGLLSLRGAGKEAIANAGGADAVWQAARAGWEP